jgi:predicted phosphodiesterase
MVEKLKTLLNINGPILVFGGVYSNLQALEAIYSKAQELGIPASNIICTGDLVAYCAQPLACLNFTKNWGIHCIAGNVEINLYQNDEDCGCNFFEGGRCDIFSRQWYPYLKNQISQTEMEWMASLPHFLQFNYAGKKVFVVHGSYANTSEFIFKSTPWEIKKNNFDSTDADVIIAGHCGIPFTDEHENKVWINAGVIGMPANDGSTNVWYCILDDANGKFSYQILPLQYEFEKAADLFDNTPLPQTYKQTLLTGIWDNCEILPPTEAKQQGKSLEFSLAKPI